ncbi:MAG: oligosaccharide flippase family protein [Acutalibacteraceae bacterium]|nr:oligosaccharide flippase family protein [Acutalibacteraceae bacterium]
MNKVKIIVNKAYSKYAAIPVAAKAALWFVACTMLQKCISFITVPIFTRLMPTEEYGIYSTYLSWYGILTAFCTLNMHSCIYVNNYTKANTKKEQDDVAVPLLSLSETLTIILFIAFVIFHKYLDDIIGLPFLVTCLLFVQILFEPPVNFWSMKQRFEYRYVLLVTRTILMVVLNSVLGIIAVSISITNQGLARVLSIVLVQAIFGGIFYLYFFKRAKKIFSVKGWKHALKVQLPLLPHQLSISILSSSDRIMINNMLGKTQAAIFSVAYSAGYIVNILKSSIVDALKPWLYQKIKEKNYTAIRKNANIVIIFVTIISFLFTAFAPEIIAIMAPEQYHEAIYVIPPVSASSFFTFLYNIFSIVGMYYEKTNKIMIASISGAALNLILNFIFIPIFGYVAAAYTTLIGYMFFAFAHYLIMKSICRQYMNNEKIFDMKFIVIMSIFILVATIAFELIYDYIFIRYAVVLVITLILFIKRKTFISAIKELKKKK